MSKFTVNEKNLASLGTKKLSKLMMNYVNKDAQLKKELRYELVASAAKGEELVGMLTKSIKSIRKSTANISTKRAQSLAKELTRLQGVLLGSVLKDDPYTAYPILWDFLYMDCELRKRVDYDLYYEHIASYFDHMEEKLLEVTAKLAPDPAVVVDCLIAYARAPQWNQLSSFAKQFVTSLDEEYLLQLKAKLAGALADFAKEMEAAKLPLAANSENMDEDQDDYEEDEEDEKTSPFDHMRDLYVKTCIALKDSKALFSELTPQELSTAKRATEMATFLLTDMQQPKEALSLLDGVKENVSKDQDILQLRIQAYEKLGNTNKLKACMWQLICMDFDIELYERYLSMLANAKERKDVARQLCLKASQYRYASTSLEFLLHNKAIGYIATVVRGLDFGGRWSYLEFGEESYSLLKNLEKVLQEGSYFKEAGKLCYMHAETILSYKGKKGYLEAAELVEHAETLLKGIGYKELDKIGYYGFESHLRKKDRYFGSYLTRRANKNSPFPW